MIWYSTVLSVHKRETLRLVFVNYWYTKLIARFKEKTSDAFNTLHIKKYMIIDTCNNKNLCIYIQAIFFHIKIIQITSIYNQLMIASNNLDKQFQVHIFKPNKDIIIQQCLNAFNAKRLIWHEIVKFSFVISTNLWTSIPRLCYASNFQVRPQNQINTI